MLVTDSSGEFPPYTVFCLPQADPKHLGLGASLQQRPGLCFPFRFFFFFLSLRRLPSPLIPGVWTAHADREVT